MITAICHCSAVPSGVVDLFPGQRPLSICKSAYFMVNNLSLCVCKLVSFTYNQQFNKFESTLTKTVGSVLYNKSESEDSEHHSIVRGDWKADHTHQIYHYSLVRMHSKLKGTASLLVSAYHAPAQAAIVSLNILYYDFIPLEHK